MKTPTFPGLLLGLGLIAHHQSRRVYATPLPDGPDFVDTVQREIKEHGNTALHASIATGFLVGGAAGTKDSLDRLKKAREEGRHIKKMGHKDDDSDDDDGDYDDGYDSDVNAGRNGIQRHPEHAPSQTRKRKREGTEMTPSSSVEIATKANKKEQLVAGATLAGSLAGFVAGAVKMIDTVSAAKSPKTTTTTGGTAVIAPLPNTSGTANTKAGGGGTAATTAAPADLKPLATTPPPPQAKAVVQAPAKTPAPAPPQAQANPPAAAAQPQPQAKA
ncbi:hypothetical protein H4R33_004698 [Dimargaris cristalligena]|uniref:Uncharacterized protein n=1 Tax=Dimargaris cristalligena TaxID=215637 RepID=A0A4P9ZM98_9FUNG|nr:hypothetical protein H4R33_004698 [Dimargaris cristalligena]RKP33370.1 hypothetical protein BJ085DRAFT_35426 [Dimargaris cristalligena]|eukprot:RKP33370.1 hypothetical protein BJ085DRAFT_35426 [Dimargaris cristalligena]